MTDDQKFGIRCSAIVFRNDHVLLVRRDRTSDWVLPGGTPRAGETVASCTRREVAEETGLHVTVDRVAFVLEAHSPDGQMHLLDLVFTVSELDRSREPEAVEPGLAPHFYPVADIGALELKPPIAGFIRNLHSRASKGEGAYLGNVWRPEATSAQDAAHAFDAWET